MQKIDGTVQVYATWNVDSARWEVDPLCFDGGPLDWTTDPYVYDRDDDYAEPEAPMASALAQAADTSIHIDDLALMLGRGVTEQAHRNGAVTPANGERPISRKLIEVIDNLLESAADDHKHELPHELQATIRARLLSIFASVDQNADRRGEYRALNTQRRTEAK